MVGAGQEAVDPVGCLGGLQVEDLELLQEVALVLGPDWLLRLPDFRVEATPAAKMVPSRNTSLLVSRV